MRQFNKLKGTKGFITIWERVLRFRYMITEKAKEQELTLPVILSLHKMLISNICDDVAGRWRINNEYVRVGNYIAPAPKEILKNLEDMLSEYNASSYENIIKRIARLHLTFERIHPFIDGNGRIGRVINNYLLIREGFVSINIKFIDRKKYYEAFLENNVWKIGI